MQITIKKTKRKTIAISIRHGKVVCHAPLGMADESIGEFITQKKQWILKHTNVTVPFGYNQNRKWIHAFGVVKEVYITHSLKRSVIEDGESLYISILECDTEGIIDKLILEHFQNKLQVHIRALVRFYCWRLNISVPTITFRKYKNLYGRCNNKGELAFNKYLYHDSWPFIHYVVLHECAHLLEFNHSAKFYDLIENIMPNYREVIDLNKKLRSIPLDQ